MASIVQDDAAAAAADETSKRSLLTAAEVDSCIAGAEKSPFLTSPYRPLPRHVLSSAMASCRISQDGSVAQGMLMLSLGAALLRSSLLSTVAVAGLPAAEAGGDLRPHTAAVAALRSVLATEAWQDDEAVRRAHHPSAIELPCKATPRVVCGYIAWMAH